MAKSYSSLRVISKAFIVLGYINLFAGLIVACFYITYNLTSDYSLPMIIMGAIGIAFASLILALIEWAIGQFIALTINTADNIANVADNVYLIAKSVEENLGKNQSKKG